MKKGIRVANGWTMTTGFTLAMCPFCGTLEMHGNAGPVFSHCLGKCDEYHIIVRRGVMPQVVKAAAAVWGTINRITKHQYTADELINQAREKFTTKEMAS